MSTGKKRSSPHTPDEGAASAASTRISPQKRVRLDNGAAVAEHLSGEQISRVLASKGPIVSLVILHDNGKSEERTVDMTPKLALPTKILSGVPTFIGQYPEFDIVVMKSSTPAADASANPHKLPFPFDKHKTKGDIILVKMNSDSIPEPLTLEEWDTLQPQIEKASRAAFDRGDIVIPAEEEEDVEPPMSEVQEALLEHVIMQFKAAQGRDPNEQELVTIMSRLNELSKIPAPVSGTAALLGDINEEDESEDEDYDPAQDHENLEEEAEAVSGGAEAADVPATKNTDAAAAKPAE